MHRAVTIAIDAMGGDHGATVSVPAALTMLVQDKSLRLILVGRPAELEPMIGAARRSLGDRLLIREATEVVAMDEHPRHALRNKKDSSMRRAIDLVRDGEADACVSAGNTGALMATARFVLRTLPGIDRPAIISAIPAVGGHTHMLDLGANADCTAPQLFQFAVMGSVVASDVHGLARPTVGLLNIGEEEIKGNATIREAHGLLAASKLNYIGFVEGDDIFSGHVDVVVSDGFTGNVSLKTMEGASSMISSYMNAEFRRNLLSRLRGLAAMPGLRSLRAKLDPRRYNGASLVGLNGIVIKSHGAADEVAFQNAIETAILEVDKGVPTQISELLEQQQAT